MRQQYVRLALWLVMHIGIGTAAAGTLIGTVTDARGQAGIKDVVVWAEPIGSAPAFSPPTQHAEMAQVTLAFTPHVLPVLVGTTVDFPNRDTMFHSVYSFSRRQRFEIGLYKPGESRSATFHTVGAVRILCNIHVNMFGTILVLPTPYFSPTDTDGAFTMANIPAGDYTVQVWHERLQGTPHTASVTTPGTTELALTLGPKRRRR